MSSRHLSLLSLPSSLSLSLCLFLYLSYFFMGLSSIASKLSPSAMALPRSAPTTITSHAFRDLFFQSSSPFHSPYLSYFFMGLSSIASKLSPSAMALPRSPPATITSHAFRDLFFQSSSPFHFLRRIGLFFHIFGTSSRSPFLHLSFHLWLSRLPFSSEI